MSDMITMEGKEYISSKRASEISGYSQDYIGQLARGGQLDAQRVGGLWFVFMPALDAYKQKAESYKPEPPTRKPIADTDSLISFDGSDYMSASRAAQVTGYHQDYVGQLARSGTILSRQVGNRWYVQREGILKHKREKDALLAAVQASSVGLARAENPKIASGDVQKNEAPVEQFFTYTTDTRDLIPMVRNAAISEAYIPAATPPSTHVLTLPKQPHILDHKRHVKYVKSQAKSSRKGMYVAVASAALTIAIVVAVEFTNFGTKEMYAAAGNASIQKTGVFGTFTAFLGRIGDALETAVARELIYKRPQ